MQNIQLTKKTIFAPFGTGLLSVLCNRLLTRSKLAPYIGDAVFHVYPFMPTIPTGWRFRFYYCFIARIPPLQETHGWQAEWVVIYLGMEHHRLEQFVGQAGSFPLLYKITFMFMENHVAKV